MHLFVTSDLSINYTLELLNKDAKLGGMQALRKLIILLIFVGGIVALDRLVVSRPSLPLRQDSYKVLSVFDGDTIEVQTDNGPEKVRFAGINAPETEKPGVVGMCMANEATDRLKALIGSSTVTLIPDSQQTNRDRYGRLLRYVVNWRNQDVSLVLVSEGLAPAMRGFDYEKKNEYLKAEGRAREAKLGVWSQECQR
jgi:endonuclease YncB( thermonuclease family)